MCGVSLEKENSKICGCMGKKQDFILLNPYFKEERPRTIPRRKYQYVHYLMIFFFLMELKNTSLIC